MNNKENKNLLSGSYKSKIDSFNKNYLNAVFPVISNIANPDLRNAIAHSKIWNDRENEIITYETKNKVRMGKYKTFDQLPINLDFFWTPNSNPRIGLYHYWRGKFTNGEFTNGCGSGLYLLKKNNPLSAVAGVVLEVSDISKFSDGYGKNFTINFVVGYNFGFAKK